MTKGLRYFAAIGIALIIIGGFGLRLYRPAADPPLWLYVYNTDEGHYSYNTHNKIKYGHWFVDEAKYALITPLFNAAQYLVAAALPNEPNIVRYRAISILAGILFCFALRLLSGAGFIGWSAAALGSITFMGVVHSRMANPEMMLTLLLLITALLAIESEKRQSLILYALTGLAAVGCAATKPTGGLMLLVLLSLPVFCRAMRGHRIRYLSGMATGVLLGGIPLLLVIVIPQYADWAKMISAATAFARDSYMPDPLGLAHSLSLHLLSPAMLTMPMFWSMALCWAIFVLAPRLKNGEADFEDTLLFLWLGFGALLFGLTSYQPARWQLLMVAPVIAVGLKFLSPMRAPLTIAVALMLALVLSALLTLVYEGGFLRTGGELEPGFGLFSHLGIFALAVSVFLSAIFVARISHAEWRTGILWGALLVDISMQALLHSAYMKPAYSRSSQWVACSRALENLRHGEQDLFAGSMVQDFSLRADIRVLPTYYVIDENRLDDRSVRDFFLRQNATPDYFLLLDVEHTPWAEKAPRFVNSLQRLGRCDLFIGGFSELRHLYVYRFRSYNWLKH